MKQAVRPKTAHGNVPSPDRPLEVGYVSADFRMHSVAYFLLPLIAHHDRGQFHITCYSATASKDDITKRFQQAAGSWRDIAMLSDEQVAQQVRKDAIDILVDLSGHTAGNRLSLFLLQPAPVQVTYLGFPDSTGIQTMQYRLTDASASVHAT